MKLKERILAGVAAGAVLVTIVLVLDVETHLTAPSGHTPAHARVQYAFRQRHLQKTSNGSREAGALAAASAQLAGGDDPGGQGLGGSAGQPRPPPSTTPPDPYSDVQSAAKKVEGASKHTRRRRKHWNPSLGELLGLDLR